MKKAFLQLHTAIFLAGFTGILGKLIQLNEVLLVWYRIALTVIILGAYLKWRNKLPRLTRKAFIQIGLVGFIIAFHWVCFYASIKYANVSVALICFSATGFFTALLEPLILRRKPVWIEFLLGLMAIAGIFIIFDFHPEYKLGIIFGITAAIGSALFPIFNKQQLEEHEPLPLTFYEMLGAILLLSIAVPVYLHFFPAELYYPSPADWGWLIILSVFCTIICFDLQLQSLKKISAFTTNLSYNLEPVYGILMAFVFFDEGKLLNRGFYLGLSLIIASIVLQTIRMKRQVALQASS